MILAHYKPLHITVRVIDVLSTGNGRKRVLIRAIEGEPFCKYTMGGPMTTDSAVIDPGQLADAWRVEDPKPAGRRSRQPGFDKDQVQLYRATPEIAGMFPAPHGHYSRRSLGGPNND